MGCWVQSEERQAWVVKMSVMIYILIMEHHRPFAVMMEKTMLMTMMTKDQRGAKEAVLRLGNQAIMGNGTRHVRDKDGRAELGI